jgi:hypothetical protein
MKKSEMKKILKPLIRECIKEVIFEDGILSSVISEVMIAAGGLGPKREKIQESTPKVDNKREDMNRIRKNQLQEQRQSMLDAIGNDAFNGVNLFEGTIPAPRQQEGSQQGPLSGMAAEDPGVDISNLTKNNVWKKLAGN